MIPNTTDRGAPVTTDRLLTAVADEHRRAVLRSLEATEDSTMALSELVDHVGSSLDAEDSRHLETVLHHVHLPKLASCGLVEYDPATRTVRHRPTSRCTVLLDAIETIETMGR